MKPSMFSNASSYRPIHLHVCMSQSLFIPTFLYQSTAWAVHFLSIFLNQWLQLGGWVGTLCVPNSSCSNGMIGHHFHLTPSHTFYSCTPRMHICLHGGWGIRKPHHDGYSTHSWHLIHTMSPSSCHWNSSELQIVSLVHSLTISIAVSYIYRLVAQHRCMPICAHFPQLGNGMTSQRKGQRRIQQV